jgi:ElaB/YqjD/DUF883 family membrane-anchored ribosome-binding protein
LSGIKATVRRPPILEEINRSWAMDHALQAKFRKDGDRIDAKELLSVLGRDLKQVERDLGAIGASISSPVTQDIAVAGDELRQSVGAFLEKAKETGGAVREEAKERAEVLHEHMAKHPVAAASSALALGYLLGRTALARRQHASNR